MKKIIFYGILFTILLAQESIAQQCTSCINSTISNNSSALGYFNTATGTGSVAIGSYNITSAQGSIAIGRYLSVPQDYTYNIVIGSGYNESQRLVNNIGPCLMVGFRSNVHTFLVNAATANGKTGKVSIGNVSSPLAKFHIKADTDEDASVLLEAPGTNKAAIIKLNGTKNCISSPGRTAPLAFLTGGENTRMVITAESGKIGIGDFSATEPEGKVHIKAKDNEDATLIIEPSTNSRVSGLLFKNSPGNIATIDPNQPINFYTGSTILRMKIDPHGNVGIGTETPSKPLHVVGSSLFVGNMYLSQSNIYVDGEIKAKKFMALPDPWADDVFDSDYYLLKLEDLENYIKLYHHLPDVPTAHQVKDNGIELAETISILLRKIEELTLYTIQQQKEIDELKIKINE